MNYDSPIDALYPAVVIADPVNVGDQPPTDRQIWESAMEGIEDPADFEYSEDESNEEAEEEDEEETNIEEKKEPQIPLAPRSHTSVAESIGSKYAATPYISTLDAKPLSHTELIRELMLTLRQLPTQTPITCRGLRSGFVDSVIQRFQEYRDDIWGLDEARRKAVLDKLFDCKPTTLIQLSLMVEQVYYEHAVSRCDTTFDASVINSLLSGDPYIVKRELGMAEFVRQFADLPPQFKHRHLCMASCFALIAKTAFNTRVPNPSIGSVTKEAYQLTVHRLYLRNAQALLAAGLRKTMEETWHALAAVYLAQDPRMLKFLDLWLNEDSEHSRTPQVLLDSVWPDSGVTFDEDMWPCLTIKLPSIVEQFYGRDMSNLFSTESLKKCWTQILEAIRHHIPETELHMASLTKATTKRIDEIQIPEPTLNLI